MEYIHLGTTFVQSVPKGPDYYSPFYVFHYFICWRRYIRPRRCASKSILYISKFIIYVFTPPISIQLSFTNYHLSQEVTSPNFSGFICCVYDFDASVTTVTSVRRDKLSHWTARRCTDLDKLSFDPCRDVISICFNTSLTDISRTRAHLAKVSVGISLSYKKVKGSLHL